MNCAKTRVLLDLHLEGRLPEAQSRAIESHLKSCDACARLARTLRPAKAQAAPMPAELKEKLRRSLLEAKPALERSGREEKEPVSALSLAAGAPVVFALCLPFASLVGAWDPQAGLGAALRLGALAALAALLAHGLLSGRLAASRRQLPALLIAGALLAWRVCAGALGPAFLLPEALQLAAGPALFIVAALALGGADEAARALKSAALAAAGLLAAALLTRGRIAPASASAGFDVAGAALTALLALAVLLEAARALPRFARLGSRAERRALLALGAGAVACAAAAGWLSRPGFEALAWICAGAASGLCALAGSGEPFAAAAVPLERESRRALAGALACGLAALAVFPARWLADDYALSGAQRLMTLAGSEGDALARADAIWRTSPSWPAAQLLAGDALLGQEKPGEALARLSRLESLSPDYPGLAYRQGLAYGKLEDWPRALACHERARAAQPSFVPNLERLAVAAKLTGDFALARQTALTVISLEPKDPAHWLALSDIALRQALAEKAARRGERHVRRPQPKKKSEL